MCKTTTTTKKKKKLYGIMMPISEFVFKAIYYVNKVKQS